jgi:hypothetical protein
MNRHVTLLSMVSLIGCGPAEPIAPSTPVPVATSPVAGASTSSPSTAGAAGRGGSPAAGAGGSMATSAPPLTSDAGASAGPAPGGAGGGAAAGAGGSAGAAAPPTYQPRFSAIYSEIFQSARCTIPTCHGTALALETLASAYTSLVGVMSTGSICGGSGRVLVMASAPDQSLLVQKLREAPPCGDRMPPGNPLSEQQLNQIVTWIQNGAKND